MAFDGSEEQPTRENVPPEMAGEPPLPGPAGYELPPLIPSASREPVWLLLLGIACFLGLMLLIWRSHQAPEGARSANFQQSVAARTSTYLVALLQYHRLRGELPAWASDALQIEELAARTAGDWRSISEETGDAGHGGLTALNASALYHAAGDDAAAREMIGHAAQRDRENAIHYRALLPLYADPPRPVSVIPPVSRLLERISAGPLVKAHIAELQGDSAAALEALRPGARAGQRVALVTGGFVVATGLLLLGVLLTLIITGARLMSVLRNIERTPSPEVPWGVGVGLIVISLSYVTVSILRSVLVKAMAVQEGSDTAMMLSLFATLLGPLLIISLFLLALGRKPWEWSALGWTPTRRGMRYGIGALLLSLPLIFMAAILSSRIIGNQQGANPLISEMLTAHNPLLLAMIIATAILVAPLIEETLFRGILFRAADARLPFWGAAFGSGLIFAMGHYILVALLPITLLGILFALLTRRSQSLFASAAAHAGYNGMVTAVVLLLSWALRGPGE
jgi:hypothetical protein